jgi:hypothetical protein
VCRLACAVPLHKPCGRHEQGRTTSGNDKGMVGVLMCHRNFLELSLNAFAVKR